MLKKVISAIIAVMMLLALLPEGIIASAATTAEGWCGDNLKWTLSNGVLKITGSGYMWDYGVDQYIGDVPITSAPWGMMVFTSAVIGSGVKNIGTCAFTGCYDMTSISVPSSVEVIDVGAFAYCYGLASFPVAGGVWYIGDYAFEYCQNMASFPFTSNVSYIGDGAFFACWSMAGIGIPDGVETLGADAFSCCFGVETIAIGSGVSRIGENAFYGCNPSVFAVNTNNSIYYSNGNCLIERKTRRIIRGTNTSTIPSDIKIIGAGAFGLCDGLTVVSIPGSVTTIESRAFYGDTQMTDITIPASVTSIAVDAFKYYDDFEHILPVTLHVYFDSYAKEFAENNNFNYALIGTSSGTCGEALTWTLTDGALVISGYGRMYNYFLNAPWGRGVQSVVINNGVTGIGEWAFADCWGLTSVSLPDSLTSIGYCAFYNCDSLTRVTIPKSVTDISYTVFTHEYSNLSGLVLRVYDGSYAMQYAIDHWIEYEIIPQCGLNLTWSLVNGVLTITGTGDMYDYDSFSPAPWSKADVVELVISRGVTSIGNNAFENCVGLKRATIPDSVTDIGYCAFSGCIALSSINISGVLTHLGSMAFYNTGYSSNPGNWYNNALYIANWLSETNNQINGDVNIKEGTIGIADGVFSGRIRVESITMPDTVLSIGLEAFSDCVALENVELSNNLKSIDKYSFVGCENLSVLNIPDSVNYIERGAFEYCPKLILKVLRDSYAHAYAVDNNLKYEIIEYPISSISVSKLPNKTAYMERSEALDVTGGRVTLYYTNGTSKTIDMTNDMVSGFDNTRVGSQTLTVSYEGKTAFFSVTITARTALRIAVTTLPAKTSYLEGKDKLDVAGGRITVYYNSGPSEVLDMTAAMVSGFDNNKVGDQTLTVTYNGKTATFNVTIVAKTLKGISVAQLPNKLEYLIDSEPFDVTGGKIKLIYDNGSSIITSMLASMVSGFDNTILGRQTLTVTYKGFTDTFDVYVVTAAGELTKGDADGDGVVTVNDALSALRIAAKLVEPTADDFAVLDIDGDGVIAVNDALAILRVAAKLVNSL